MLVNVTSRLHLAAALAFVAAGAGTASAQTVEPQGSPSVTPSARATDSRAMVRADLGRIDALAQRLARPTPAASLHADLAAIDKRWPQVRSELVGQGASRSDLLAADSAVSSLDASSGAGIARAANGLTAALAPMYGAVGDHVPARVHRLDYLHRAMILDVAQGDWVRANGDSVSARSTWRAIRPTVVKGDAANQSTTYTQTLDAVQDAVAVHSAPRFNRAISRADSALGAVEKALDTEEPPWRRFLHAIGF